MNLSDFDFTLPDSLIAQHPAPERDHSKMMVIWKETGKREHLRFRDLPDILNREHFLVLNKTRVLPARLRAHRPGKKEDIEILLLRELQSGDWMALVKPGRKAPLGQMLEIGELSAQVLEVTESGSRVFRFQPSTNLMEAFERLGEPPTPPYIHRQSAWDFSEDRIRYQTVYAEHSGSVAAPTAGLHFTEEILHRLSTRGIDVCKLLLHVGYGTFKPIRAEVIEEHAMEPEFYAIDDSTASQIRTLKTSGRKLVSVGTTTTRCLEFLARQARSLDHGSSGYCNLFIYPGFQFKMLDGLITNFHLPRSTLFMLVCAFAGRELMLDCYREAVSMDYRFYSYGDCMLLI
jgi:S-adenosylmethionine:tRNA ribosyltransferase-isomerase